jgi:HEPN domain-containing protein
MQPERRATAAAWRAGAAQDLRIAKTLAEDEANAACFHAQQCAEKALKSALVVALDDIPRSHVCTMLLDELGVAGFAAAEDVREAARVLDRYYAPTRYPDAVGDIDPARLFSAKDSGAAIAYAECVMVFCDAIAAPSEF